VYVRDTAALTTSFSNAQLLLGPISGVAAVAGYYNKF